MLTGELRSQSLPYLHLHDKVYQALQLMNDNQVAHLPVVDGEKYAGIISEDDLMLVDNDHVEINTLQQSFGNAAVKNSEHFLKAIQVAAENGLSIVPIVDEENLLQGAVSYNDLLRHASEFMSLKEPGGLIVLEVDSNQYSFNEISKLVETNDAHITQLNSYYDNTSETFFVTIKINKFEISDIVATFQRYDYTVKYYFGEELYENELRTNYDHLMNYLNM